MVILEPPILILLILPPLAYPRPRSQISDAFGVGFRDIVFTSGATEAAALALNGQGFQAANIEHDAVTAWVFQR